MLSSPGDTRSALLILLICRSHSRVHRRPRATEHISRTASMPGGGMARRGTGRGPKQPALREARCWTRIPSRYPMWRSWPEIFDARDADQVKHQMVRAPSPWTRCGSPPPWRRRYSAALIYGSCRRWSDPGWKDWCPPGPGRAGRDSYRGDPGLGRAGAGRRPALRPAALAGPIEANFGVHAHPRSIERALARHRERHSKSR